MTSKLIFQKSIIVFGSCLWFFLIFLVSKNIVFYDIKRILTYSSTEGVIINVLKKTIPTFSMRHRGSAYHVEVEFYKNGIKVKEATERPGGFYYSDIGKKVKVFYSSDGDVYVSNWGSTIMAYIPIFFLYGLTFLFIQKPLKKTVNKFTSHKRTI